MAEPSITARKQAFIRTQIRHLSAPLTVPPPAATSTTSDPLPPKTTSDLVAKTNAKLRSHATAVYSAASQRHVAEQIETLYWNAAQGLDASAERDTTCVARGAELRETSALQNLPETWDGVFVSADHDEEADEEEEGRSARYARLRQQALERAERRDALRRKLAQHRRLKALLAPLEQARERVQPNLATKDGELGAELERMQGLLARVQGRVVAGGKSAEDGDGDGSVVQEEKAQTDRDKVARLLELT